jgi:LmbE family N-acetylglucosaminyl deacetylase
MPSAVAIAAHPDDIEYVMAGTLLLLWQAGWDIHYLNLASGNCGSHEMDAATAARTRLGEAQEAARLLGATFHAPLVDDLEIVYTPDLLRRVLAVVREANPAVVLTHSPQDYMEDHMETSRLAVTAAFAKNFPNFPSQPPRPAVPGDVTVYHAQPHGGRDGLRRRVVPGLFVDTSSVIETKLAALACHRSQQGWLAATQGMNSYLQAMLDASAAAGALSGHFPHAEGWRRHSHIGFSVTEVDPLAAVLGEKCLVNSDYEASLEHPG